MKDAPGGRINILGGHSICYSKQKFYMCVCSVPNLLRDAASSLNRLATRHVFTRVVKCTDVDGGNFESLLYWVNCANFSFQQ
jgi:hypothetical protein